MPLLKTDPRISWVDDRQEAKLRVCLLCQSGFWSADAAHRLCSGCRKKINDSPSPKAVITPVGEEYSRDSC